MSRTDVLGVGFDDLTMEEAVEAAARETGLPGRMIPIPSEVSAGCGLAWCVPAEERDALLDAFESGGLAYEAVHEVELY